MVGSLERINVAEKTVTDLFKGVRIVDPLDIPVWPPKPANWRLYSIEYDGFTREGRVLRQRDDGTWEDVTDQAVAKPPSDASRAP